MAAFAPITVADRTPTTPVNHTFVPGDKDKGAAFFIEAASVPIGNRVISIRWRKSVGKYYGRLVLTNPVLVTEVINGVSVSRVDHASLADVTFRFDEKSTEQHRKDTVGMLANSLASSQTLVSDTLINLNGVY